MNHLNFIIFYFIRDSQTLESDSSRDVNENDDMNYNSESSEDVEDYEDPSVFL